MKNRAIKQIRVLAISPSTRGFGFAVLDERVAFVDWGVKSMTRDKNARCLAKVGELIEHYQPSVMVLEDPSNKRSRRSIRVRTLIQEIVDLASTREINVALYSQDQVRNLFFGKSSGTKHDTAQILAKWFPEELGTRLPPKRQPWMSEDYRMGIFDAAALALTYRPKKKKPISLKLPEQV